MKQNPPHIFLGEGHKQSESRTWRVIWLCGAMMVIEIGGGLWFGSIALVADGLHMSTHAGAMLLAALAYTFARKHAEDPRFSFGTGKLGDLAGFTSAIILAMISILIAYESLTRFFNPVPIHFSEAIPIACLGLVVNIVSAWMLNGGVGGHSHGHGHSHGEAGHEHHEHDTGKHDTGKTGRDNNMRAAVVHVVADAAVSVLVIIGLILAKLFGWLWLDPVIGVVGALVIANWAVGLIRDTGGILLDMTPDRAMEAKLRAAIENEGDELADLHLWRLGPGHLGAILCIGTRQGREPGYYKAKLASFEGLSHLTVEVTQS
jgi:cation diffusion facilitator family transporter